MEQAVDYILANWMKLFLIGAGGLAFVMLVLFALRGPNGRWRWDN